MPQDKKSNSKKKKNSRKGKSRPMRRLMVRNKAGVLIPAIVIKERGKSLVPKKYQKGNLSKNLVKDLKFMALPPGKRISKEGNVYYEYRPNRSDIRYDHPSTAFVYLPKSYRGIITDAKKERVEARKAKKSKKAKKTKKKKVKKAVKSK